MSKPTFDDFDDFFNQSPEPNSSVPLADSALQTLANESATTEELLCNNVNSNALSPATSCADQFNEASFTTTQPCEALALSQRSLLERSIAREQSLHDVEERKTLNINVCNAKHDPPLSEGTTRKHDEVREDYETMDNVSTDTDIQRIETIHDTIIMNPEIEDANEPGGNRKLEGEQEEDIPIVPLNATGECIHESQRQIDSISDSATFEEPEDDFGTFDDFDDFENDEYSNFKENQAEETNEFPVFRSAEEAADLWRTELIKTFGEMVVFDNYTQDSPKSIQIMVVEEATELTWASVIHSMSDDTGTPKVKWHHSEIEKLHLAALHCQRNKQSNQVVVPSTLSINSIDHTDEEMLVSTTHYTQPTEASPSSPSSKSSSGFGFSFAKFLPRISTTIMPKSPASTLRSPSTNRSSVDTVDVATAGSPVTVSSPTMLSQFTSPTSVPSDHPRLLSHTRARSDASNVTKSVITRVNSISPAQAFVPSDNQQAYQDNIPSILRTKKEAGARISLDSTFRKAQPRLPDKVSRNILDFDDSVTVKSPTKAFHGSLTPLVPSPHKTYSATAPALLNTNSRRHTTPAEFIIPWENMNSTEVQAKQIIRNPMPVQRSMSSSFDILIPTNHSATPITNKNISIADADIEFGEFADSSAINHDDDDDDFGDFAAIDTKDNGEDWGEWTASKTDLMQ
ncbi:hypothetical protein DFQ28_005319 [Apophysomyces sp. BC1034]|nr:hypothetical protein DFQ28_005319 [Apophysomyces sp. BC1034]